MTARKEIRVGEMHGKFHDTVVRIEAVSTLDRAGHFLAMHCWIKCSNANHGERRERVSVVARGKAPECPTCRHERRLGAALILPWGEVIDVATARYKYATCDFVVSEVRQRAAPAPKVSLEDLPLKDRAIEYGRRGFGEREIAQMLSLEVNELRQLLRG